MTFAGVYVFVALFVVAFGAAVVGGVIIVFFLLCILVLHDWL